VKIRRRQRNHNYPKNCFYRNRREIHMKCFNRTKLIPSLAASAMVAVATLAPLPGFLTAGNVYAHDDTTPHVEVGKLARLNLFSQGQNGIDAPIIYMCSPTGSTSPNVSVTVTQSSEQSGSGVEAMGTNSMTPITCDGYWHKVAIAVTPTTPTNGAFNVSRATVAATLTDPSGATKSDTEIVDVEV
jgi:hypothetical protein